MMQFGIVACWGICAAGLAAYAALMAQEITYVTLADGRKTERKLPLAFRLLLPFVPNLRRLAGGPGMAKTRALAEEMIASAGMEGLLTGEEFAALKILTPLALGGTCAVALGIMSALAPDSPIAQNAPLLGVLGFALAYLYPLRWLRMAVARRHLEIMKALPFVLDLLTLSVEAGMDFMSAMQRNCSRRKLDALNEELIRMTQEIQVGTPRRVALRNMAERVKQPDLSSVAHALIQADELGVSIGSILRIQSEQLRGRRFERAEKLANEAPVKMLGPLMLCIFPAVFVILLGPILMQAARSTF